MEDGCGGAQALWDMGEGLSSSTISSSARGSCRIEWTRSGGKVRILFPLACAFLMILIAEKISLVLMQAGSRDLRPGKSWSRISFRRCGLLRISHTCGYITPTTCELAQTTIL